MSSENLQQHDRDFFLWQEHNTLENYVLATYIISTPLDGEQAALGIAREQSICATELQDIEFPKDIEEFCAKVVHVETTVLPAQDIAPLYFLNTPVYGQGAKSLELRCFSIAIAYPIQLFGNSLSRL